MVALKETNENLIKKLNNYLLKNFIPNQERECFKKLKTSKLEEESYPLFEEELNDYTLKKENNLVFSHSLPNYLEQKLDNNNFQKTLFSFIDKTNKKDSEIYNKAFIDRRLFSKIRNDETYHPTKQTIISLGLALELNIEDFETLLQSASYSLPKNNYFDLIIRFCIEEKIYNIIEVNTLLHEYNCNTLN